MLRCVSYESRWSDWTLSHAAQVRPAQAKDRDGVPDGALAGGLASSAARRLQERSRQWGDHPEDGVRGVASDGALSEVNSIPAERCLLHR